MKGRLFFCAILLLLFLGLSPSIGFAWVVQPSASDLWDVHYSSNPIQILEHTPTYTSGYSGGTVTYSVEAMFGAVTNQTYPDAQTNTIFADGKPAGFTDYVVWRTPLPIHLTGFRLYSEIDSDGTVKPAVRQIINFRLFYSTDGTSWTGIEDRNTQELYNSRFLEYAKDGLDFTASYFKAEFVRAADVEVFPGRYGGGGPRVVELDGFGTVVPIPAAAWLLGSGLLGLVALRRRFNGR